MILRDRDNNGGGGGGGWTGAGDGTLEERRYTLQNWRGDLSVVIRDGGGGGANPLIVEWVKYSAYGVPIVIPFSDVNSDGVVNSGDYSAWITRHAAGLSSYDVRVDANLDGTINSGDTNAFTNDWAGFPTAGRGSLSRSDTANRLGYAGYQWDPSISKYHVRHRVYDPVNGRWTRRDPLGYVDGMSLYQYVSSSPVLDVDPTGLEIAFPPPPPPAIVIPAPPMDPAPFRLTIPEACPRPAVTSIGARCVAAKAGTICCSAVAVGTVVCCLTGVTGVVVGCWISETWIVPIMPEPDPHLPPLPKRPPPPKPRRPQDDCSMDRLSALNAAKVAACQSFVNNQRPCEFMRSGSPAACATAAMLQGCIQLRQDVLQWHRRCDPEYSPDGKPTRPQLERQKGHENWIRNLGRGQSECQKKCSSGGGGGRDGGGRGRAST